MVDLRQRRAPLEFDLVKRLPPIQFGVKSSRVVSVASQVSVFDMGRATGKVARLDVVDADADLARIARFIKERGLQPSIFRDLHRAVMNYGGSLISRLVDEAVEIREGVFQSTPVNAMRYEASRMDPWARLRVSDLAVDYGLAAQREPYSLGDAVRAAETRLRDAQERLTRRSFIVESEPLLRFNRKRWPK